MMAPEGHHVAAPVIDTRAVYQTTGRRHLLAENAALSAASDRGTLDQARCPLCLAAQSQPYHEDRVRPYRQCPRCQLVFVPPAYHLARAAEKAVYDRHENSPDDPGYRRFLGRLFQPLQARLPARSRGLDFGAGPGPTLSLMFQERGHTVVIYDPLYHPDQSVFDHTYDFITATEVVEHLHHPHRELPRLWSCLDAGGVLGIMTKLVRNRAAFAGWHYTRDPTHVAFFSRATFEYLAASLGAALIFFAADALALVKPT